MHLRKEIARQLIISTALIVGCAGAIYGKTKLLEELDNSTHVVLYVGDTISVKLKSNITTGYSWSTVDLPASVELVKSKNEPGKEGKVGNLVYIHSLLRPSSPANPCFFCATPARLRKTNQRQKHSACHFRLGIGPQLLQTRFIDFPRNICLHGRVSI